MSDESTTGRPPDPEEEIFESCLARPIEERARYLDQVCAGDAALRRRVEELLRSHSLAESFLEEPPAGIGAGQMSRVDSARILPRLNDIEGRRSATKRVGTYSRLSHKLTAVLDA